MAEEGGGSRRKAERPSDGATIRLDWGLLHRNQTQRGRYGGRDTLSGLDSVRAFAHQEEVAQHNGMSPRRIAVRGSELVACRRLAR